MANVVDKVSLQRVAFFSIQPCFFVLFLIILSLTQGGFTMKDRKAAAVELIQKTVGNSQVLCLISGG